MNERRGRARGASEARGPQRDAAERERRRRAGPRALGRILAFYEVDEAGVEDVRRFLAKHRRVTPLLLEAIPHLKRVFGDAPVRLEVHVDPEEGRQELFGVVLLSDVGPEEPLDLLDRFDKEWFGAVWPRVALRLNFDVEIIEDRGV